MFNLNLAAHLAELSKIEFTDSELNKIAKEMDEIIALMDAVSDFSETENPTVNPAVKLDAIREDIPKSSMPRKDVLKNAAEKSSKAFTVPKVV